MREIRNPSDGEQLARAVEREQTVLSELEEELLPRIADLKTELAGIKHDKDWHNRLQHPCARPVIERQQSEGS